MAAMGAMGACGQEAQQSMSIDASSDLALCWAAPHAKVPPMGGNFMWFRAQEGSRRSQKNLRDLSNYHHRFAVQGLVAAQQACKAEANIAALVLQSCGSTLAVS